jgi:hypothetical protein
MYSKLSRWLSLVGLLTFVAFDAAAQAPAAAAPASAPAPAPGTQLRGDIRATRVVGVVTWEDKVTKAISPLAENQIIHDNAIVHTGENASVLLLFSSGASISLAHTSDLDIENFTQDPFASYEPAKEKEEPSISNTSIKLTRGELVGNVKKLKNAGQPGGSKFTVGTPVGAAGIRGTTFRIVYRPTGNGQAFNFVMTTLEGNVEVTLATGTVAAPPVSVTDNNEVVINNVTVNTTTNEVTVTNNAGQTTVVATPPAAQAADLTNVQAVTAAAQQIAQAVANVVFTAPTTTNTNTGNTGGTGNTGTGGDTTNNGTPNNNGTSGTNDTNNNSNQGTNNNSNQTPNNSNNSNNSNNNNSNNNNSNNNNSNLNGSPGGTSNTPHLTPGAGTGN